MFKCEATSEYLAIDDKKELYCSDENTIKGNTVTFIFSN